MDARCRRLVARGSTGIGSAPRPGPGRPPHSAPHFDGAFVRTRDERSLLTFMVYLNECPGGGATNFLSLGHSVTPRTGSALLFNHHLLHEGATVTQGRKYALRTDPMYRRPAS
ncbi:2OG-Fe(II) oxygenase [Myxococcus virescens]|uniref:2OG-Fe(II) oxygenase n=1 Tax=Myxococcus virescens TaxID=83456 RepID=UPI003DA4DC69